MLSVNSGKIAYYDVTSPCCAYASVGWPKVMPSVKIHSNYIISCMLRHQLQRYTFPENLENLAHMPMVGTRLSFPPAH